MKHFGRWLAAISVLGLALRVGYVLLFRVSHLPFAGDSAYYQVVGNLLGRGHGFVIPVNFLDTSHFLQDASHPPLYQIWLAIPTFVTRTTMTQRLDVFWSCVLGAGTVALCGLAGREVAGPRVGIAAAALAAVYPNLWVHDGMLLSETMAIFTSVGVLLFAYRFLHRPTGRRAVWLGMWCGLATLARSELALLVPVLLVPVVAFTRGVDWQRRLRSLALGVGAAALVIVPWVGYNLSRFNDPVYLSTNLSGTLSAANCDATYYGRYLGYKSYGCGDAYFREAIRKHRDFGSFDQSQQDAAIRGVVLPYIRAHASRVPVVVAARLGRITELYRPFQEVSTDELLYGQSRWIGLSLVYSYYLVVVLAVGGAVTLRRRRAPLWPLLALPVVVLVSVTLTFAQTRYRAPAEPALVILAAVAITGAVGRAARDRGAHTGPLDPSRRDATTGDDDALAAASR